MNLSADDLRVLSIALRNEAITNEGNRAKLVELARFLEEAEKALRNDPDVRVSFVQIPDDLDIHDSKHPHFHRTA